VATQTKQKASRNLTPTKFTEKQAAFLMERNLARLATTSRGQPHVVPIIYEFDGSYLYFSGWNLAQTLMYRQIEDNAMVALVVDEAPGFPTQWDARGVEVRGIAEIMHCHDSAYVRITPMKSVSWGL
jgi:PPOX class F420-dependent enzyme/OxyR family protein